MCPYSQSVPATGKSIVMHQGFQAAIRCRIDAMEDRSDKFTWNDADVQFIKVTPRPAPEDDPEFLANLEAFKEGGKEPASKEAGEESTL